MRTRTPLQVLLMLAFTTIPFIVAAGSAPADSGKKTFNEKSLLWEVSGNGLGQPSYIYGTIHLISKKDFMISEKVQRAMDKSSRLVMEMVIEPGQYQKIMSDMVMSYSLDSLLSKEDYEKVSGFISDSLKLGMFFFNRMKPFFTYQTIYTSVALGRDPASYELKFTEIFREQKKPVEGLESLDFQTAIFDKIPYDLQAKMLVQAVDSAAKMKQELAELIALYKSEDIEAMVSSSVDKSDLGKYSEVLLDNRNTTWIPKLEKLMKRETVFIAVGAAHLGGEKGILNLLRKADYNVKPIR